jgi:hypothetical protein
MMFYNTHSYEHMKEQLEERRIEHAWLRRADAIQQDARPSLVSRLGGVLIRLGSWLEQPTRALEQVRG